MEESLTDPYLNIFAFGKFDHQFVIPANTYSLHNNKQDRQILTASKQTNPPHPSSGPVWPKPAPCGLIVWGNSPLLVQYNGLILLPRSYRLQTMMNYK